MGRRFGRFEWLMLALLQLASAQVSLQSAANVPFKTSFVSATDYAQRRNGALVSLPLSSTEIRGQAEALLGSAANLDSTLDEGSFALRELSFLREPDFQSERRQAKNSESELGAEQSDDLLAASSAETASTRSGQGEASVTTTVATTSSTASSANATTTIQPTTSPTISTTTTFASPIIITTTTGAISTTSTTSLPTTTTGHMPTSTSISTSTSTSNSTSTSTSTSTSLPTISTTNASTTMATTTSTIPAMTSNSSTTETSTRAIDSNSTTIPSVTSTSSNGVQTNSRSSRCGGRHEPNCGEYLIGVVPVVEQPWSSNKTSGGGQRVVNEFVFVPENSGLLFEENYPTRRPNESIDSNLLRAEHRGAESDDVELDYVNSDGGDSLLGKWAKPVVLGEGETTASSTVTPFSTSTTTTAASTTSTMKTTSTSTVQTPRTNQLAAGARLSTTSTPPTTATATSRRAATSSRPNQKLLRLSESWSTTQAPTTRRPTPSFEQVKRTRPSSSAHRQFFSEPAPDLRRIRNKQSQQATSTGADEDEAKILTRFPLSSQLSRLSSGPSTTTTSTTTVASVSVSSTSSRPTAAPINLSTSRAPLGELERKSNLSSIRQMDKRVADSTSSRGPSSTTSTTSTAAPIQEHLVLIADSRQSESTRNYATSTSSRRPPSRFITVSSTPPPPKANSKRLTDELDEYEGSVEDQLAKDALHTNRTPREEPSAKRNSNSYTSKPRGPSAEQQSWQDSGQWQAGAGEEQEVVSRQLPGRPGVDYPTHWQVPKTSFDCRNYHLSGFYADVESDCQAYHSCHRGRGGRHTFLCPNGTLFSQELLTCDWWYNVECSSSKLYHRAEGSGQQLG